MKTMSPEQFLKRASDVASFYGFRPARDIAASEAAPRRAAVRSSSFENVAAMCASALSSHPLDPVLTYYATSSPTYMPSDYSARETAEFGVQIAGAPQSISDALVVKTIVAILNENGAPVERIRLNTLGDRESRERFARELMGFLRRRLPALSDVDSDDRDRIFSDPLSAYASTNAGIRTMLEEAPRTVHFLSERSRAHFREVLEHFERVQLPYEIDDALVGDEREPRIVFHIDLKEQGGGVVVGSMGGRYDEYVARLAGRREGSTVNGSVFFRKKGASRESFSYRTQTRPKTYFIQLGLRAKLAGFGVLDVLREAHISVSQSFDASKFAPQLEAARKVGVSYVIIMGEREALDKTVIVRSMKNSSQTIVEIPRLPKFLKTFRV